MDPYDLHLEWPVADVLAYALLRTIDDLEARAIVAEHHDPDLGPVSATGYRTDISRLQTILARIAPGTRDPTPARRPSVGSTAPTRSSPADPCG